MTIGHQYPDVVLLPEREVQGGSPWVAPLAVQRVSSDDDKEVVGALQVGDLLDDEGLPFHGQLCAEVVDSSYCKPVYLFANRPKANLVTIVRVRSNRTFYRQAPLCGPTGSAGHPPPNNSRIDSEFGVYFPDSNEAKQEGDRHQTRTGWCNGVDQADDDKWTSMAWSG